TPHLADHRLIALRVAQVQPQNLAPLLGLERFHISNVVVLEKDAGEIGFQFRCRNVHAPVLRSASIADARQHVGNRIGHAHVKGPGCMSGQSGAATSSTSERRESFRSTTGRGNKSGTTRTFAETRASARSAGSGCADAPRTSACACSFRPWLYEPSHSPVLT